MNKLEKRYSALFIAVPERLRFVGNERAIGSLCFRELVRRLNHQEIGDDLLPDGLNSTLSSMRAMYLGRS